MKFNSPFDPPPEVYGEYMALLVYPETDTIPNRRYWNGSWSGPYFANDSEEDKAKAKRRSTQFNLYWAPVPD